jgi:NADPH2:quinone reductase
MNAAVLEAFGRPPRFRPFAEPTTREGEVTVHVRAAALKPIDKQLAAGTHYGSRSLQLPAVCGTDGVGQLEDGARVFFAMPQAPFGAMADRTVVHAKRCFPLPDNIDDVTAAAIFNPGLAAWGSLAWRAQLQPGESVLILGATGVTGKLAIQTAKLLGASRVVAAGRNEETLKALPALGADAMVRLEGSREKLIEAFAHEAGDRGFDVILDFLWGTPTEALLATFTRGDLGPASVRTRLIEVGETAGPAITLPAAVLRSSRLEILGAGTGSAPPLEMWMGAIQQLLARVAGGQLRIDTDPVPLASVESAWLRSTPGRRIVLIP